MCVYIYIFFFNAQIDILSTMGLTTSYSSLSIRDRVLQFTCCATNVCINYIVSVLNLARTTVILEAL